MKTITFLIALFIFDLGFSQTVFKLDSIHQYSPDMSPTGWKFNTRDLYTYDNGGNKETNLLRLNLNGMVWENFYQFNKSYNGNNDLIESILQNWDGMNWINGSRDSYTYTPGNQVEKYSYAIYSAMAWLVFNENNYTYDMDNLIEDLRTELDFSTMLQKNDARYTYDYTGTVRNYEIYEDWVGTVWVNQEKSDYMYNPNSTVSLEEVRAWGTMTMAWSDPFRQYLFNYTMDDLLEEVVEQVFVDPNWVNVSRFVTIYTDGNPTTMTAQEWNSTTMLWDDSSRQRRMFDTDGNETELIFETWNTTTMMWDGIIRQVKFWMPAGPLSVEEIPLPEDRISVYPNPTSEVINIFSTVTLDSIELYNLLGKRVLTTSATNRIAIGHLPAGIYLLKLTASKGILTKKVIIK